MKGNELIIFSGEGKIPDVQIVFVAQREPIDATCRIVGNRAEILSGLACILHTVSEKLGFRDVLMSVDAYLDQDGLIDQVIEDLRKNLEDDDLIG